MRFRLFGPCVVNDIDRRTRRIQLTVAEIFHIVTFKAKIWKNMKSNQRAVKHFDCVVSASIRGKNGKASVNPVNLRDILQAFKRTLAAGHVVEHRSIGEIQVWSLKEIDFDDQNKYAIALVTRSDRNAADQAISDTSNGSMRVATKNKLEGNAYSSHIAFRLDSVKGNKDIYLMLLEEANGISVGKVQQLFKIASNVARDAGESIFKYPHPDGTLDKKGNPKTLQANYSFEIMGHPALDFIKELNNGVLHGIEVVNAQKTTKKWDSYNETEYLSSSVRLKPVKNRSQTNMNLIRSVCSNAKINGMQEVRIRFTDTEDVSHTVGLDVDNATLMNEDRFIKKTFINNFIQRLDTGFNNIHEEIKLKMFYLIR